MFRKRLMHVAQLSAVGLTGYYVGQNIDKFHNFVWNDSIIVDGKRVKSMPGLPVFGTVSAATPYTDTGSSKDRVRSVLVKLCFSRVNIPIDLIIYESWRRYFERKKVILECRSDFTRFQSFI